MSSPATRPCCGRAEKKEGTNHADLSKIRAFHADAVPTWEPRSFIIQRPTQTRAGRHHGNTDRNRFGGPVPGELGKCITNHCISINLFLIRFVLNGKDNLYK